MKGDICSIEGCEKIVKSGIVCEMHWWRMKTYKTYDKPSRKHFGDFCKAPDCKNPRDIRQRSSLCTLHRTRMSKYKSLELPIRPQLPEGIAYICHLHGHLSFEEAYQNPKDGYFSCLKCRRMSEIKMKEKNPTAHHTMTRNFYFFGRETPKLKISVIEYNRLLAEQNGACKICKKPETMKAGKCRKYERGEQNKKSSKRLAIDHCHRSWTEDKILIIRGLLCHRCNTAIGALKDDIKILESAIQYLKESDSFNRFNDYLNFAKVVNNNLNQILED